MMASDTSHGVYPLRTDGAGSSAPRQMTGPTFAAGATFNPFAR